MRPDGLRSSDSLLGSSAMLRAVGIGLERSDGSPDDREIAAPHAADGPMAERVTRLSGGQLDCLRLVDQHLNSKEIAAELGISPHTVDQRIRGAIHTLGVERRSQAARIVARYGGEYQRLIHQSPHIEGHRGDAQSEAA